MTDAVHSFHAPIYADTSIKRLPPSFYWGVGIAVLLHLALAFYLLQQNFAPLIADEPKEPHIIGEVFTMPKELPKPAPTPKTVVPVHTPILETPPTVPTAPIAPAKADPNASSTTSLPALTPTGDGSATASASESSFVTARWTRFPDGNALTDYYPAKAADNEVEGMATVQCTVLDAQGRVTCSTVAETPKGYNFGAQTVKMVQDKGRVDISQGNVKIGSVLRTTVKWQLPQ